MSARLRLFFLLGFSALVVLVASAFAGTAPLAPAEVWAAIMGQGSEGARLIVWDIRLPRAVAAFGVGAALGLAGAAMQGYLQNPLAEPGVLGVSSAASLGAVAVLYFGLAAPGSVLMMLAAILAALAAVALLFVAAAPHAGRVQLILAGAGLSSLCGALIALAFNLAPNPYSLADLMNWMLGSVANRAWTDIRFVLPVWVLGAGLVFFAAPALRALTLGEETAASLGVDLMRTRALVMTGTALLTGASVAIAGAISFVGLVAPHLVRRAVREDPARVLGASALAGGVLLVLADMLIRAAAFDPELKLGVAAALFGAPAFLWIALRARTLAA